MLDGQCEEVRVLGEILRNGELVTELNNYALIMCLWGSKRVGGETTKTK